ncbi:hypothetical protein [Phytohabitans suffuscus]|uniref:Uncharacterized protein n=1 Tax=Phytohabitans suffuscus TaxID=624315 RepID=A0A6F8YLP5_9ACTN|nr:hypothetical protein [Phytohabitans suffuscus]BCB86997.1 hypothetical protein Psuf_043100 [Phytohabitans suffuscus]
MTAVLAIYGALVGTFSLGWTVASWLLSAGRARVELRAGLSNAAGQFMTTPIPRDGKIDISPNLALVGSGMTNPILLVSVRNVGRLAITVEQVAFRASTGQEYGTVSGPEHGKQFPCVIQPGASERFGYDLGGLQIFATTIQKAVPGAVRVAAIVDLGTGKRVKARAKAVLGSSGAAA